MRTGRTRSKVQRSRVLAPLSREDTNSSSTQRTCVCQCFEPNSQSLLVLRGWAAFTKAKNKYRRKPETNLQHRK